MRSFIIENTINDIWFDNIISLFFYCMLKEIITPHVNSDNLSSVLKKNDIDFYTKKVYLS